MNSVKLKYLIKYFLAFSFLSLPLDAKNLCLANYSQVSNLQFNESHFKPSEFGVFSNPEYPKLASEWANMVSDKLQTNTTISELKQLLLVIASERNQFQATRGGKNFKLFGAKRNVLMQSGLGSFKNVLNTFHKSYKFWDHFVTNNSKDHTQFHEGYYQFQGHWSTLGFIPIFVPGERIAINETIPFNYRTLNSDSIPTTNIFFITESNFDKATKLGYPEFYYFKHTDPEYLQQIMSDVFKRLEIILNSSGLTKKQKLEHFFSAMYGYFHAMPFMRGSASIGRSFFSGVYLKVFNSFPKYMDTDVDVFALVSEQTQFVEKHVKLNYRSKSK